jgi:hypothetical protein
MVALNGSVQGRGIALIEGDCVGSGSQINFEVQYDRVASENGGSHHVVRAQGELPGRVSFRG